MSQKSTVSQRIAREIHHQILRRAYQPGERLPTERALAAHYGVSRIPVREAIKILTQRGVIETKHGSGNYVTSIDEEKIADQIYQYVMLCDAGIKDIYTFWKILEEYVVGAAAKRRTPEQLERIKELRDACAAEIRSALDGQPYNYIETDNALHLAIAQASGNRIAASLIAAFHKGLHLRQNLINERLELLAKVTGIHDAIVRGIEKQDPEMARLAMREDLNLGLELLDIFTEKYKMHNISTAN